GLTICSLDVHCFACHPYLTFLTFGPGRIKILERLIHTGVLPAAGLDDDIVSCYVRSDFIRVVGTCSFGPFLDRDDLAWLKGCFISCVGQRDNAETEQNDDNNAPLHDGPPTRYRLERIAPYIDFESNLLILQNSWCGLWRAQTEPNYGCRW